MSGLHETAAERAEAAAIRRRWITLGEIVAIAGLIISALALWNSYADRRADKAEREAEKISEARAETAVLLRGTARDGGNKLEVSDPAHPIQGIALAFPRRLGLPAQSSSANPVIEARWFAAKLIAISDGGADEQRGRLPVLIASDYWQGDNHITATAIYDVVWRSEGRMLQGRAIRLEGLVLRQRKGASLDALDAIWAKEAPPPAG